MLVDTRPEIQSFIASWRNTPREQVIPEIASVYQESHTIPDVYWFEGDEDDDLFSPTAKGKVRNFIQTNTTIGQLEGVAFDKINQWFKDNESGLAVWVSPQDAEFYPNDSKIVISEIVRKGKKRLINRAIILDYDQKRCLEFAKDLAEKSLNRPFLESVSEVRVTPLFLSAIGWIDAMSELIVDPGMWGKIRAGQDFEDQKIALERAEIIYDRIFDGRDIESYLGEGKLTCPIRMGGTAFEMFLANSIVFESCQKISCKKCPWVASDDEVKKIQERKITCCPKCGWEPSKKI